MDGMAAPIAINPLSAREQLRRYVATALARLRLQEALRALNVVILLSLLLLAATIITDRLCSFTRLGINVYMIWACVTALGIPYILWRTFSPRLHEDLASVLADDRLGLNSRLSTALTLDLDDPQNAAFSEAFFAEALTRLQGLKVETAFPIKPPRSAPFLLLPALASAALYQWMPFQDQLGLIAGQQKKLKAEEIQQKMAKKLDGKLEDLKKKVDEQTEEQGASVKMTQLIEKADQISKELKEGKRNPEEAVIGLGQLKREIQEEQERLTEGKEFLDRLEKLKAENLNLEDTALTRDVSEALKMGDPGQAARELRKLSQKIKDDILNDGTKTDAEKKAALDKLRKEVEKLAGALAEDEALRDQLQELSKKTMDAAEYEALEEEIQKQLERQGKGRKQMGDEIQQQIEDVADELERLEEDNDAKLNEDEQDEMDQLEAMEEGIDEALEGAQEGEQAEGEGQQGEGQQAQQGGGGKNGKGKKAKKGQGSGKNMKGKGRMARGQGGQEGGQQGRQGGRGQGQGEEGRETGRPGDGTGGGGPGQGHRPYQDGDATFQKEKVKGQLQSGAITGISHFRGQGAKGEAPVEFKQALEAAEQERSSSLELERIPSDARDVVKDYFSKVKEGAQSAPAPTPAGK